MYFLWLYGRSVERHLGSVGFALAYILGAFASVGLHLLTVSPLLADEPAIGASGAISTVLGFFFVAWPGARLRCLFFWVFSFRPIMVQAPAAVVLGLWFLGQLAYSLQLAGDIGPVAFWAHVGGFAVGALLAWVTQSLGEGRHDANEEELSLLPGIGPSKARRIVDHIRNNGPVRGAAELESVNGIGPATAARLERWFQWPEANREEMVSD